MSLPSRSFAFISLLALAATPAAAGTTRTVNSGLGCVQAYGAWETKTSYGDDGGFYSDATDWFRTAVCPLPRASTYFKNATAAVDVVDQNYSIDANCRIVARAATWTTWGPAAVTSGSNPASQRLTVAHSSADFALANVHLLCYLPPAYDGNRSGVIGFDGSLSSLF